MRKFELTMDPVGAIRSILAEGDVPAKEFRRLAREAGVPTGSYRLYQWAKIAGAHARKRGPVGEGGYWVWSLARDEEQGLVTRPGRKGFYAHFWHRGREIQEKLSDDLAEARALLAERKADLARSVPPTFRPPRRKPVKIVPPIPEPKPEGAEPPPPIDATTLALMARIAELEKRLKEASPEAKLPPPTPKVRNLVQITWQAVKWAIEREPSLAWVSCRVLFTWLQGCAEWKDRLPSTHGSFQRHLWEANHVLGPTGRYPWPEGGEK